MLYSIALVISCIAFTANSQMNTANCAANNNQTACEMIPGACEWVDSAPDYCRCASASKFDILFGIDGSGSVGNANFGIMLDFLDEFTTHGINIMESRIGFTQFATNIITSQEPTYWNSPQDLTNYINGISFTGGWTNTDELLVTALYQFNDTFLTPDRQQILIILTDGVPQVNSIPQDVCLQKPALDAAGIRTIIVAIGNFDETSVECLVNDPADLINVPGFEFEIILEQLSEVACPYTTLSPTEAPTTAEPTPSPTPYPTPAPTPVPSQPPSPGPTPIPTPSPSPVPTAAPTPAPSNPPTCYTDEPSPYYVIRNFYGGILTDNTVQTNNVHFECELIGNHQIWQRIPADTMGACSNVTADYVFKNYESEDYLYAADNKVYAKVVDDATDPGVCWNVNNGTSTEIEGDFAFFAYHRLENAHASTERFPKSGGNCNDPNGITTVNDDKKDDSSLFWFIPIDMVPV